jgi:methionine--tRNA ligase beta chain
MKNTDVNFNDFSKIDLRVGKILEITKIEGSSKMLKLKVDLGEELGDRIVMSGIGKQYKEKQLKDKLIIFLVNLGSKQIMGVESAGMILAGEDGEEITLLKPDKNVKPGTKIF